MASYRRDVAPMTGTLQTSDTGGDQDVTRVEPSGFTQATPANERGDDREPGLVSAFRETKGANPEATALSQESTQQIVADREDLSAEHRPYESEYAPRLDEVGALGTMVARQQPSSVNMVTNHRGSAVPLDSAYDVNAEGNAEEPMQVPRAEGGGVGPMGGGVPLSTEEAAEREVAANEQAIEQGSETTELGEGGGATTSQEVYDEEFDQQSQAGNLATSTDNHEKMATAVESSPDDQPMGDKDVEAPAGDTGEPAQGGPVDAGADEGSQDDSKGTDETPSETVSEAGIERPNKSDRKEEWVDYAQHIGVETTYRDEDGEVKDKTKDALIEEIDQREAQDEQ